MIAGGHPLGSTRIDDRSETSTETEDKLRQMTARANSAEDSVVTLKGKVRSLQNKVTSLQSEVSSLRNKDSSGPKNVVRNFSLANDNLCE
jgi:predicted  nucleic acid-binding Zn-ribbon protein